MNSGDCSLRTRGNVLKVSALVLLVEFGSRRFHRNAGMQCQNTENHSLSNHRHGNLKSYFSDGSEVLTAA
jgi:hypothetical protein